MMTTSNSPDSQHTLHAEPSEGLTILQLLRRDCGQEYTEEDRRFEAFVTDLIARLETYTQILKIIEEAEKASTIPSEKLRRSGVL